MSGRLPSCSTSACDLTDRIRGAVPTRRTPTVTSRPARIRKFCDPTEGSSGEAVDVAGEPTIEVRDHVALIVCRQRDVDPIEHIGPFRVMPQTLCSEGNPGHECKCFGKIFELEPLAQGPVTLEPLHARDRSRDGPRSPIEAAQQFDRALGSVSIGKQLRDEVGRSGCAHHIECVAGDQSKIGCRNSGGRSNTTAAPDPGAAPLTESK